MIALGSVLTFGSMTFQDHYTQSLAFNHATNVNYQAIAGQAVPLDPWGVSNAPLKDMMLTAEIGIVAPHDPASNRMKVVQDAVNVLYAAWRLQNADGTGGQVQTLSVRDADGSTIRTCRARLAVFPVEATAGKNSMHVIVKFVWYLQTEFA